MNIHVGVVRQMMGYLSSADLLPSLQSEFRYGHSTETAVLWVLSDIIKAVDRGDTAALILLDLSAAYDTVDNALLLQRLQTTFGIDDRAHRWFQSYLSGRHQYVRREYARSTIVYLICGVPQPSGFCAGTSSVRFEHRGADLADWTPWSSRRIFTPTTPMYTARVRLLYCGCTFIAGHRVRWCHFDLNEIK